MHELLLYGQVPGARHEQVLKILAGIAAMQPRSYYERQLIYRPLRSTDEAKPNKKYPNKPVKPPTLTYHQLVQGLVEDDFGKEAPLSASQDSKDDSEAPHSWLMRLIDTPEPEIKTIVLRPVNEVTMNDEALQKILNPADYNFVAEFMIEGHHVVHKNMLVSLFRVLRHDGQPQTAPSTILPSLESFAPFDASGAFVLEARVRIDDRTKPTLVSAASDELNAFRDLMRGSVDMKAPERLALDTRAR